MADRPIIMGRRDWMQEPSATIGGGVWTHPLVNVLDPRPQFVAEAADNQDYSSTTFDADLGYTRKVGLIFFANLRTTMMGVIRLYAGTDPTFTVNEYEIVTSTWPQDTVAFSYNAWGEYTMSGVYSGVEYVKLGMPRFFIPPAIIDCRYIRVEIRDSTAVEPLQIGCFGACEIWEPPLNFAYGWSKTEMDESAVDRVPYGSTYITERGIRGRLNFGFPTLPEDEVWARAFGLILIKGTSTPFVVVPFPDRDTQIEKQALYGRVSLASQLSNPFFSRYALPFQVDQDI